MEILPLYKQRVQTTLRPASSHHSTTSGTHTTIQPASSHHSTISELKPANSHHSTAHTITLTTTYAFTLTRPGLPGCLMALAYTDSVSPLKSCNLSTAYTKPHTYYTYTPHTHTHTHTHTHYTYTYIHVAQAITL